jgi:hypothetical protein
MDLEATGTKRKMQLSELDEWCELSISQFKNIQRENQKMA